MEQIRKKVGEEQALSWRNEIMNKINSSQVRCNIGSLSKGRFTRSHTLNIIRDLEKKGFVNVKPSGREVIITLTDKGKKALEWFNSGKIEGYLNILHLQ